MVRGLRAALDQPVPRLVVAHGLLLSVVQWSRVHPVEPLSDVFLLSAPCLTPIILADDELAALTQRLLRGLDGKEGARAWRADLGVFPVDLRPALATVTAGASLRRRTKVTNEEAAHA